MDPNTFFQDRVLGRLYGEAEQKSPDREVDSKSEDTSEIDKALHTTVRKVYTVSLPPKDWCEKSSVTENPNTERDTSIIENSITEQDTSLLSTTETSSEQSGSDDISQPVHKRRKRRGKRFKTDHRCKDSAHDSETVSKCQNVEEKRKTLKDSTEDETKPKLTKNQKRKLKKKKRNEKLRERVDHGISKEFVYKGNEQLNKNKT